MRIFSAEQRNAHFVGNFGAEIGPSVDGQHLAPGRSKTLRSRNYPELSRDYIF